MRNKLRRLTAVLRKACIRFFTIGYFKTAVMLGRSLNTISIILTSLNNNY